ncbi:MAG TPA: hypothetical protein VFW44_19590 [Bryobacteraceae bacterium]|nr:hypothetical protein [Bryobacteraceae bacterium]
MPFQAHIDLLRLYLTHREQTVESLERVLNAQRKPIQYLQDRSLLSREIEDCFFERAGVVESQTHLRSQLEASHWAAGFRPRPVPDLHNDLIDPAEIIIRAFFCWSETRWPGRNGRVHFAHTLFNLYVLRSLQFLSMRLWDEDPGDASRRLEQIQGVLDELWSSSPGGQPVIVRDARWLIPLVQSLITDDLAPYFEVARQVTETLSPADVLEIQMAHVRMLGAHLTSQIRYYSTKDGVPIDDLSIVLRTRTSNALDFALLIQGLVDLLKAYEWALQSGDERVRLEMAGAVVQGISVDPELFLNRLDLLGAYSMIEHVFIAERDGHIAYSPLGERHVQRLNDYHALIHRLRAPLRDDLPRFRPLEGGYSPYGIVFGLPSHLIEHMALKALQHDAETRFSLEDMFDDRDTSAAKLAWVNGWRKLPHIDREVQRLYDYPQQFAEEIYDRIGHELTIDSNARTGRLYLASGDDPAIPVLPDRYFASTDQMVAARQEGHFLVSYETPGGWIALKKELLTEVLGAGRDARIVGLPAAAAQVLRLMCTGLVMPESVAQ